MSLEGNMAMHARNYAKGEGENPRFWARLGGAPPLAGRRVLDLGCGLGSLATDVARAGAREVVGVDLDEENIAFARRHVRAAAPDVADRVRFVCADVRSLRAGPFDYAVSKDAFEHIDDLPDVLRATLDRVAPGGRMFVALGPLYHSHRGDHGRFRLPVPWAHAVLPEALLLAQLRLRTGLAARSLADLGLNGYTVEDFRRVFRECGARVVSLRENQHERALARAVSGLRRVPGLERYLTWNMYCVLEKPT